MKKLLLLVALVASAFVACASSMKCAPYRGAISATADGHILYADNADRLAYPASVTKLMTALLVLEDVRANRYSFLDKVTATPDVYRCEPSWVGIKPGEKMSVRDLLFALMIESANDAAIALGIHSAGSFDAFVSRMNARAKQLGMTNTTYYNPNGLPPNKSRRYPWTQFNVSTARDQLRLAVQLLKYPEILEFTSVKTADLVKTPDGYRVSVTRQVNRPIRTTRLWPGESLVKNLRNHNNVMVKDKKKVLGPDGRECVDGLKTGYIDAGGSSVVVTGTRKGKRVIAVVLGSDSVLDSKGRVVKKSADVRDEHARRLIVDALDAQSW